MTYAMMLMAMIYCVHFAVFDCVVVYCDVYINSDFCNNTMVSSIKTYMIHKFWTKMSLGIKRDHKTCLYAKHSKLLNG